MLAHFHFSSSVKYDDDLQNTKDDLLKKQELILT